MSGITVSYSGVHQAYQIALAACEMGKLERFYCSLFDAPRSWGGLLSGITADDILINRRRPEISSDKVSENPWPLLVHHLLARVGLTRANDWLMASNQFDSWVGRRLLQSDSSVFVGVETCALRSFEAAKRRGMTLVLDHPAIPAAILKANTLKAANQTGLPIRAEEDRPEMSVRKERELNLADWVLAYSPFHRKTLIEVGVPYNKIVEIPLWGDQGLWAPPVSKETQINRPLRVICVGAISLRKGIPYLLEAVRECAAEIDLTLVGSRTSETNRLLENSAGAVKVMGPQAKTRLRELYERSDVFVFPSLGDSWGFVAIEAMLSGLPVILTENCGVPVPDKSWRVPIMDSRAIANRLEIYNSDRSLCHAHGEVALEFARQFTPERYRESLKEFFAKLLR